MKKLLILAAVLVLASVLTAQRTTRRSLKAEPKSIENASAPVDTVLSPDEHTVDINGYDKPLRSRRETFFATNNSERHLEGVAFTITYLDRAGRQLHKATHNLAADIPPAETRQLSYRSWDEQQAFYYIRSAVPERAQQATPYDVRITIDTLFFSR